MPRQLFVSFEDDIIPTIQDATECNLVAVDVTINLNDEENPVTTSSPKKVPLLPATAHDLKLFAEFMGWEYKMENGQVVLKTGVPVQ